MKKGILLRKNHERDTTKFKLCVYYSKKLSGEFFTELEKKENKNRKYHDSIDFVLTSGGNATRHDYALNKLLHHLVKWENHIERALLFMNDFGNNKQYLIGRFEPDETKNLFIQPEFTHYKRMNYTEKIIHSPDAIEIKQKEIEVNEVFCTGLIVPALNTFDLKPQKSH